MGLLIFTMLNELLLQQGENILKKTKKIFFMKYIVVNVGKK